MVRAIPLDAVSASMPAHGHLDRPTLRDCARPSTGSKPKAAEYRSHLRVESASTKPPPAMIKKPISIAGRTKPGEGLTPTQRGVLDQFAKLGIRSLVIGGRAMKALGIDRPTRDLDLWIARDLANAEAMATFLSKVSNPPPLDRLQQPNFKFTVGDPARPDVDLLTSVAGDPAFDECHERSLKMSVHGNPIRVVSAVDLLAIKVASLQQMELDAANAGLSTEERAAAEATAQKERRDAGLLKMLIAAGG